MPQDPDNVAAVIGLIYAGGRAERLGGVDKAGLLVGGQRLADLVARRMRPQCGRLVLLTGPSHGRQPFVPDDVVPVADDGRGPASALLNAIPSLDQEIPSPTFFFTASVDAPFVPTNLAHRLGEEMSPGTDAVAARFEDKDYPTHVLWHATCLMAMAEEISDPADMSLFSLLDRVNWRSADFTAEFDANPFVNVNSISDLLACNRRAAGPAGPSLS